MRKTSDDSLGYFAVKLASLSIIPEGRLSIEPAAIDHRSSRYTRSFSLTSSEKSDMVWMMLEIADSWVWHRKAIHTYQLMVLERYDCFRFKQKERLINQRNLELGLSLPELRALCSIEEWARSLLRRKRNWQSHKCISLNNVKIQSDERWDGYQCQQISSNPVPQMKVGSPLSFYFFGLFFLCSKMKI